MTELGNFTLTEANPALKNIYLSKGETGALIVFKTPIRKSKQFQVRWKGGEVTTVKKIAGFQHTPVCVAPFDAFGIELCGKGTRRYKELQFDLFVGNFSELLLIDLEMRLESFYVDYNRENPEAPEFIVGDAVKLFYQSKFDADGNLVFYCGGKMTLPVWWRINPGSKADQLVRQIHKRIKQAISIMGKKMEKMKHSEKALHALYSFDMVHTICRIKTLEVPIVSIHHQALLSMS